MTLKIDSVAGLETMEQLPEVVILYGATWCNPCKQFLPHFEKASETLDIPFAVVYLDELEGTDEAEQFAQRNIQSVPTVRYWSHGAPLELKERRVLGFIKEIHEQRV